MNLYNELLKAKEATAKRWDDLLGDWKDEEERKAVREKILKGKEYENVDKFDLYATLKAMKDGGSNLLGFDQLIERLNVIDDYDDAKKNAQRIIAMLKFLNNLKKDGVCFGEFAVDPISKSWPRQDSAYDQKKFEEIINIDLKYLYKHFFKEQ